ncbi:TIGR03936 family radical SAM-associated protein [Flindersiella endophytica]
MSPRNAPPERHTPPAVQRLRLRYARRGRLRFSSHRDFQRALERAVRRAGIPIAYSAGFSPHPKISYAGAAPTGTASEAEYVEIAVVEHCEPHDIRQALDEALPDGLDVLDVVTAGSGNLAERLQASSWRIELPGVETAELDRATTEFLARESIEVERLTKNGRRVFDIRGAVRRLATTGGNVGSTESCAILQLVVRHETPAVRPDDVLAGLRLVAGLVLSVPPRATRLAQGLWDEESGTVGDPLAPDRDAAVTSV